MPTVADLPKPVARFIQAVNDTNRELLISTFAEDAFVNDQLCEHRGAEAIGRWADAELIGKALHMDVIDARKHYATVILSARVDGDFDKLGLPDPLVLHFYFTTRRGKLIQLTILPKAEA